MEQSYLTRIVDKELDIAMRSAGAVLIKGAKWCGKTRTAAERAASAIYLQDINKKKTYQDALESMPSLLLEGETPRLIDEWQDAPILWDGVRFEVDRRGKPGQFILTGSSVPSDNVVMHSGAGRFSKVHMRPMTLFESFESNGTISLRSLFDGDEIKGISTLTIEKLAFALARGGWPVSIGKEEPAALRVVRDYLDIVIDTDVSRIDGVERNPAKVRKLMRSVARNISTTAKMKTLCDDVDGDDPGDRISDKTVASYMNALERIFVIENLPAWDPDMRSKTAVRTSPKRHFVDPSIAASLLRLSPNGMLKDFNTFGLLFESLCIRDLRVYAQALDGEVFHYRDRSGLEADAVIQLYDGRWGAVEVKMGADWIDEAAKNLIKLREKINADEMGEPSFLMVLTATEFGYRRNDGVHVVPIGCLKD